MLNNQADLAIVPSTRAYSVLTSGGSYWKVAGAVNFLGMNEFAIPKGAPHPNVAEAFVRFAAQPAQQTKMADYVGGVVPANKAAKAPTLTGVAKTVNPDEYPTSPVNTQYWSAHYNQLATLFNNFATS